MTFTPFPKKDNRPPPVDPRREASEHDAGEVAAHALIQTFRGPKDWVRFYAEHTGPAHYAERIFPPSLFSDTARFAFLWFFREIERAKKGSGEWKIQ